MKSGITLVLFVVLVVGTVIALWCGPINAPKPQPLYIVGVETEPAGMQPGETYTERGPDGSTTTKHATVVGYRIGTRNGRILFTAQPWPE